MGSDATLPDSKQRAKFTGHSSRAQASNERDRLMSRASTKETARMARKLVKIYGDNEAAAEQMGVGTRSLRLWLSGGHVMSGSAAKLAKLLIKIDG